MAIPPTTKVMGIRANVFMKADNKVEFEGDSGKMEKEKYSHFEFLEKKVEVLQEQIELISEILDQNDLVKTTKETAGIDIDDATFRKLEEE